MKELHNAESSLHLYSSGSLLCSLFHLCVSFVCCERPSANLWPVKMKESESRPRKYYVILSQPRVKVLQAINACYTSPDEWIARRMRYGAMTNCDISSSVRLLAEFFYFRQSVPSLCSVHQIPVSHTPGVGSNDDLFTVSIRSSWDEYINPWLVSIGLITGIVKCVNRNLAF
jgi:hypothetical protein